MKEVQIDAIEKNGQVFWQVRLGQRGLTFREELAARAFAAQLHLRMKWLRNQLTEPPKQV